MPAYLERSDVVALKWVAGYPSNKPKGLPYISGLVVLNDAETGLAIAIMDGAEITAARTAAASGACVRRFAREGWQSATILGCGEQGRFHARLLRELNPAARIRAWDPHPERVEALGADPAATPAEAVAGTDVVVTAAPLVDRPEPWIDADALGEEWLVLPIDFDALVRPKLVESANLFLVDDVAQFEYYRSLGRFRGWPTPAGTVGDALGGTDSPRRVVCCNLGVGALDAAFAARVLARARERGAGAELRR
jgi:alanine dehydrogenase